MEASMAESASATATIEARWEGGMRYRAGRPGGPTLVMDGGREEAPSPVEALVSSLAACSAIDVVEILQKRRTPPTSLHVEVAYERAPSPPRRLTRVIARFHVATASERSHVERAIALSFEKYCSVSASLDPELPIAWELELSEPDGAG
jgi:putative redox protein